MCSFPGIRTQLEKSMWKLEGRLAPEPVTTD